MTPGQQSALDELKAMAQVGDAIEILSWTAPTSDSARLSVEVTLSCESIVSIPEGIPLRQRERFKVEVPPDFPFEYPSALTRHTRWADHPHVQWGRQLCLYQAPETDWNPSDGMFGFIERLYHWLERAAIDQLDPLGAPLHPPVAYVTDSSLPLIVPRADTPKVTGAPWFGFAKTDRVSDSRIDVIGWSELSEPAPDPPLAAAVLLASTGPFEFPTKVRDLLTMLESRGAPIRPFLSVLGLAATNNAHGEPLLVLIGTPARGIRGSAHYLQNLVAWYLPPPLATGLRLTLEQSAQSEALREIGAAAETIVLEWAEAAQVSWCSVSEARSEVTVRRDETSALAWFKGRTIAVWGCGAVGGLVAETLARAGVSELLLHDNRSVTPGVLVRQPYDDSDIGRNKARALGDRLQRIRPDLRVRVDTRNLMRGALESEDWAAGADLAIDATASPAVQKKLELKRRTNKTASAVIASMAVGHRAKHAILTVALPEYSGGTADLMRKTKIEVLSRPGLEHFSDDFWPSERHDPFQPEPGCSAPTFEGGYAEVSALAGSMATALAEHLQADERQPSHVKLICLPTDLITPVSTQFSFEPDIQFTDAISGYDIRLAPSAMADLYAWSRRMRRLRGTYVETCGHLWGERDDATRVLWITEVSGPPPDSRAALDGFQCGVQGVAEIASERETRTRGAIRFVGMWHTHPGQQPLPSIIDHDAMHQIVDAAFPPSPISVLLIVGGDLERGGKGAAFVYERSKPPHFPSIAAKPIQVPVPSLQPTRLSRDVGLALSGGGSRAIAFQLGCLRALNDRGILHRISVISGVSGGAILAAMYAYSTDPFAEFDVRVQRLLRQGLTADFAKRFLASIRLPQSAASFALSAFPRLRRFVTRTHAFEDVLRVRLFGDTRMTDPRRNDLDVVITATELRTGTAFRFGSLETGCWRFGRLADPDVRLSRAVTASASYPTLLPGFDEQLEFLRADGTIISERVLLSDGGIVDNLGTTCFEPDRSPNISSNVFRPRYIVSCDASRGALDDESVPRWWPSRVVRAADSVFKRSQDSVRRRLFGFQQTGQIEGFILPYLGTQDHRLPAPPPDLVPREEVSNYPTNFSAMKQSELERLALRGEQLTRLLITRYLPSL